MMRIGVGLLTAALMLIVVSGFWPTLPESPEAPVQPAESVPVSAALLVPIVPIAPIVPMPAPAARCETTQMSGSHTARFEWEARQGALEDVADVCPAGKATPTQLNCAPVDGTHGVMGYAGIKCVQQAACTLCGDDLARKREVDQSAHAL